MARNTPRYFAEHPGRAGEPPRFFWKPGPALRAEGWKLERIPAEEIRNACADEGELRAEAFKRAEQLNAEVDRWRQGLAPLSAPRSDARASGGVGGAAADRASPRPEGPIKPRSIAALIREYKKSRFYLDRAENTRASYRLNLNIIEAWAGDMPASAIGPARVQKLYESLYAATPAKASHVVAVLRILLQFGIRIEWLRSNAAEQPGIVGAPFAGKLWPLDAVSLFVEQADRMGWHSIGTAVVINYWLGQREADVLGLMDSSYRDGRFHITQEKTDATIAVPHAPWVAGRIEAELKRRDARLAAKLAGKVVAIGDAREVAGRNDRPLLICETTGEPWAASYFQHMFAKIRAAAADDDKGAGWHTFTMPDGSEQPLAELDFRHLRHTAVTELALASCTIPEIASITGHTIKSVHAILQRYLVMNSAIAAAAMAKRLTLDTEIAALLPAPQGA
jgi:hypothetical protein